MADSCPEYSNKHLPPFNCENKHMSVRSATPFNSFFYNSAKCAKLFHSQLCYRVERYIFKSYDIEFKSRI